MIFQVGKYTFRFVNIGASYEIFEKREKIWEFVGIAKNSQVLNSFYNLVRKQVEQENVYNSP